MIAALPATGVSVAALSSRARLWARRCRWLRRGETRRLRCEIKGVGERRSGDGGAGGAIDFVVCRAFSMRSRELQRCLLRAWAQRALRDMEPW